MSRLLVVVILAICSHAIYAQTVFFDSPRLDAFVANLTDKSNSRHYDLASKQSAIHKRLIQDCMRNLGFDDKATSALADWQAALYGKYAYCQDHHIPGIDPPCPSEDVVDNSMNNSCYNTAQDKIDWSHKIRLIGSKHFVDEWKLDFSNPTVQAIEKSWSSCMQKERFYYTTRFELYSSFGEASALSTNLEARERYQSEVLQTAEICFESTNYYPKRKQLADSLVVEYFRSHRTTFEELLERYEAAEIAADAAIEQYCEEDRLAIIQIYEKDQYSENTICSQ